LHLVLLLSAFSLLSCDIPTEEEEESYRIVVKVVDGDTINLEDPENPKPERVRLIGIDAPETRKSPGKEVHPFGKVSTAYLKELLAGGEVRLEYDITRKDRYGRTLAYVYLPDGTFVNARMIEEGYATIMTIQPNSKHADLFYELQKQAQEAKKGIWSDDALWQ
jgi:micrococcal nuclease